MEQAQDLIKRLLSKKAKSAQTTNAKDRLKNTLNQADNVLNEFAEGGIGDIVSNPYLNARRSWNEHVGSLVTAKQSWQFIAILCLLIALASVGGVIYIGSQSKFIPYVVEVDKLGQTLSVGAVKASTNTDPRIIHATIARFITNARMITSDPNLQRKAIYEVYAHLSQNDPATQKMDEWLNGVPENNPFKRAETETVNIQIRTIVPQSQDTWQVEWIETTRNNEGIMQGLPITWRVLISIYGANSTNITDEQLRNNPLGIYVKDFNWSRVN